jgi:hypothetical protein
VVGDDEPEHRVAQELEALVGAVAGVLRAVAPVGQRRGQPARVLEGTTEPVVEPSEAVDAGQ